MQIKLPYPGIAAESLSKDSSSLLSMRRFLAGLFYQHSDDHNTYRGPSDVLHSCWMLTILKSVCEFRYASV